MSLWQPASTLPKTSSFAFPLVRCRPCTFSGPCVPCFPVPAASKDTSISAGSAVRVLLVAGQLISLSLMQTASPRTEITSNQLNWLSKAAEMDIRPVHGPEVWKAKSMAKHMNASLQLCWRERNDRKTGNVFILISFNLSFTELENNLGCQGPLEVCSSVPWSKQVWVQGHLQLFRALLHWVLILSEEAECSLSLGSSSSASVLPWQRCFFLCPKWISPDAACVHFIILCWRCLLNIPPLNTAKSCLIPFAFSSPELNIPFDPELNTLTSKWEKQQQWVLDFGGRGWCHLPVTLHTLLSSWNCSAICSLNV